MKRLAMLAASCCLAALPAPLTAGTPGVAITSHRYALEIRPPEQRCSCIDTLDLNVGPDGPEELTLTLHPAFRVTSVEFDGDLLEVEERRERIPLRGLRRNSQHRVIVSYDGGFHPLSEFSRITDSSALVRTEELLPRGPEQITSIRASVTVPTGWKAIAAGALMSEEVHGDRMTAVWALDGRITTAGWISAGPYSFAESASPSARIGTYLLGEDSSQSAAILARTAAMLEFCSARFTAYRFPTLNIVEVDDWVGGGNVLAASSPTMVIVKKFAFRAEDPFNRVETILPHEIAHQWWPLTVFVGPEDMAFLSEGLCEFNALMFGEAVGSLTVRDSLGTHQLLRSLVSRAAKGNDLPLRQERDLRSLPSHYLKGAYVHAMLRKIMGGVPYDSLLAEYASKYALVTTGLQDFAALASARAGQHLDWFFDQWVKRGGIPRLRLYNVKSVHRDSVWRVTGRVRMSGYEKYTTFAEVVAYDDSASVASRVWVGSDSLGAYRNDVPFSIDMRSRPVRVRLDPAGEVLKIQQMAPKLSDLREPGTAMVIVGTLRNGDTLWRQARADSTAMAMGGWSCTIKADSAVTLVDLQTERVVMYGKPDENSVVTEHHARFPMRFSGDSVVVNGEALFDSTLSVMQAIENPFFPNGIWCWVARLSPGVERQLQPYDASWVLTRGLEVISKGTWKVVDPDLEVVLP